MAKDILKKGAISLIPILTFSAMLVGGWIAQNRITEAKIDRVAETQKDDTLDNTQRIATLEEAVRTIKEDNKEIKNDVKAILRAVK